MKSERFAIAVVGTALILTACGTGVSTSRTTDDVATSPPPTAASSAAPTVTATSATSSPDILKVLSDPFAGKTCKANQTLFAPGGTVLVASNATVAGVLPVLKAMDSAAQRIASLPPKTRLAICLYQRAGTTLSTADTQAAQAKHCPSDLVPVVLAPGGPFAAYTFAESGQRMTMPTSGPSLLPPCIALRR